MGAADQLSVTGFADAAKPTDRLFFALYPPLEAAASIASLAQQVRGEAGLTGKPLLTERLHVTLHHLGDHVGLRRDIVESATATAAALAVTAQPFDLCFDRVSSFSSRARNRPCVFLGDGSGVEPLMQFQQTLGEAMKRAGLGRFAEASFTPHVTLLYDDRAVAARPVAPVGWTALEFVLVHSLIGQARHIVLGRWPLLRSGDN